MPAPALAVLIPVKGGPLAKSRLALPASARLALAHAFARDTLAAARAGLPQSDVLVVTSDEGVRQWASADGAALVDDRGDGLDSAVAQACRAAFARGAHVGLVLLGDHPALTPREVTLVAAHSAPAGGLIVTDADGTGTAALLVRLGPHAPATRFGPGSARAHRRLGYRDLDVVAPGLRADVDDALSLDVALTLGVGRHTRAALDRASVNRMQATIHRSPDDGPGSALLDDGTQVELPLAALAASGLLHLRVGQRVSVELDGTGRTATRAWLTGIGEGEPIR